MEQAPEPRKNRWIVALLWFVPLWLIVSASVGIWLYLRSKEENALKETNRYVTSVSEAAMADDLMKLTKIIGPRNPATDAGKGLTRAASWIGGMLGPSNTGYPIRTLDGPTQWPLLRVELPGKDQTAPAVWVITAYDTASGTTGDSEASAVVSMIAAAREMAGDTPERAVKFVFLPHGNDTTSQDSVIRTRERLIQVIREEKAHTILCISNLGGGTDLVVSSSNPENPVLPLVGNLGKVVEAHDANLLETSLLAERLPAANISAIHPTSPGVKDLTIATGRLVELIRLASGKK